MQSSRKITIEVVGGTIASLSFGVVAYYYRQTECTVLSADMRRAGVAVKAAVERCGALSPSEVRARWARAFLAPQAPSEVSACEVQLPRVGPLVRQLEPWA